MIKFKIMFITGILLFNVIIGLMAINTIKQALFKIETRQNEIFKY